MRARGRRAGGMHLLGLAFALALGRELLLVHAPKLVARLGRRKARDLTTGCRPEEPRLRLANEFLIGLSRHAPAPVSHGRDRCPARGRCRSASVPPRGAPGSCRRHRRWAARRPRPRALRAQARAAASARGRAAAGAVRVALLAAARALERASPRPPPPSARPC